MDRILNKQHDRIKHHPSDVNNHFTSLASRLTRKINEPYHFTEFFQNISDDVNSDSFKINDTNYNEVRKILLGIKCDCSTGCDVIPIRYLKLVSDDVTSPLVHIEDSVFPSTWKIVRVCPIPKVDHAKDATEFRPISILCIFSKVFERVILHQLCQFLKVKSPLQSNPVRISKRTFYNYIIVKIEKRY